MWAARARRCRPAVTQAAPNSTPDRCSSSVLSADPTTSRSGPSGRRGPRARLPRDAATTGRPAWRRVRGTGGDQPPARSTQTGGQHRSGPPSSGRRMSFSPHGRRPSSSNMSGAYASRQFVHAPVRIGSLRHVACRPRCTDSNADQQRIPCHECPRPSRFRSSFRRGPRCPGCATRHLIAGRATCGPPARRRYSAKARPRRA